jgi:hypothetical protein
VIDATNSYLKVLTEAQECQRLHQLAGLELPEPIRGLLRETGKDSPASGPRYLPPSRTKELESPQRPATLTVMPEGWISIPTSKASVPALTMAILGTKQAPISLKQLGREIEEVRPDTGGNTAYAVIRKLLADGDIAGNTDSLSIAMKEKAGLIENGYLWASPDYLSQSDAAEYRREAIVHLLHAYENGLRMVHIVGILSSEKWVKVPIKKDGIKADIKFLENKNLVRKNEETEKWEVIKSQEPTEVGS